MSDELKIAKHGIRLYSIWGGMNGRCNNLTDPAYSRYGERGICVEWASFDDFFNDMYSTYQPGLTLDRIDNNGNYSKSNCRWATALQQANNRSTNNYITYEGIKLTATQWAARLGIKTSTFNMRLKRGWPMEKVMTATKWERVNR